MKASKKGGYPSEDAPEARAGVLGLDPLPVLRTGALVVRLRRAHPELAR